MEITTPPPLPLLALTAQGSGGRSTLAESGMYMYTGSLQHIQGFCIEREVSLVLCRVNDWMGRW